MQLPLLLLRHAGGDPLGISVVVMAILIVLGILALAGLSILVYGLYRLTR